VLAALATVVANAPAVRAQAPFQVAWRVARTDPQRVELEGTVVNNSAQDVLDVYVTAEALDRAGKVLARGIVFVTAQLPSHQAEEFSARVPNVRGTSSFKVFVSNYRAGFGRGESP
jgi:hypothetical protein